MLGAAGLLERSAETAALEAALASAREGSGSLVLVEGSAGIGKSALLDVAASSPGFTVLRGSGAELEQGMALGVARQLLGDDAVDGVPAGADELEVLYALYRGVTARADEGPVVVVVDDAHWADTPSLRLVLLCLQRAATLPVVLVVARRTGEPGAPDELLERLAAHPRVIRLFPAPLSASAVGELVAARRGPGAASELTGACAEATAGNPMYLRLLLDELDRRPDPVPVASLTPERLVPMTLTRLRRLGDDAVGVALAVAALGDRTPLRHAAALASVSLDAAASAADALAATDILRRGDPLSFVHPIVRRVVAESIPSAEIGALHARAARLLHAEGEPPERVATRLLPATRASDPWTVARLREAAAPAMELGSADAAATYLRRALEEPPAAREERVSVLVELAEAEALSGSLEAIDRLEQATALMDMPGRRARVLLDLGWTLYEAGRMSDARRAFAQALTHADEDAETEAEAHGAHFAIATLDGTLTADDVARWAAAAADGGVDSATVTQLAVAHVLGAVDAERAVELALRALAVQNADGRRVSMLSRSIPLSCLLWSDELDVAEKAIEDGLADARRRGADVQAAYLHFGRSWGRYWRGDPAAAAADAGIAVQAWSGGWSLHLAAAALWQTRALLEVDRVDEASEIVERAAHDAEHYHGAAIALRFSRGLVAAARGEWDLAAESLGAVVAAGDPLFANPSVVPARSEAAIALAATGAVAAARRLADEDVALARRFGSPRGLGAALRGRALVDGGEPGVALLIEAVAALETSPSRIELVRVLVELGAMHRSLGRRTEAREPLRRALGLAENTSLVALRRRARAELAATGARVSGDRPSGRDVLTPSERRIAELAASGRSNPEIARELFVSRKTVEFHLGNAYRKLDVHGRDALAGALERGTED